METLIVHPKNQKQLAAVEAVLKALNVAFNKKESPYNPDFVAAIKKSQEQAKNGKVVTYTHSQLADLCK
jgi:nitrate reductase assembly molybdenum cofactor insertion protein NarJ